MLRKQREGSGGGRGGWLERDKKEESQPPHPGVGSRLQAFLLGLGAGGGGAENSGLRRLSGEPSLSFGEVLKQDTGMWGCSVAILTFPELPLLGNGGAPGSRVLHTVTVHGRCLPPFSRWGNRGSGHRVANSSSSNYSDSKHWVLTVCQAQC